MEKLNRSPAGGYRVVQGDDFSHVVLTRNEFVRICTKIKDLESQLENANALNINLKRICREKANAKRGLRPKKKHSGFIIKQTREYREKILSDPQCITVIETPYSTLMDMARAKEIAWDDGLAEFFDTRENVNENKNCLIHADWRTGRNGLWEVVCLHTKPINLQDFPDENKTARAK